MKSYPKIPAFDHPKVNSDIFSHNETIVLEKYDGGNIRFTLYESEFHTQYSDSVLNCDPTDGDIVFGSKGKVKGKVDESTEKFAGAYENVILFLRSSVNRDAIRDFQSKYGPVTIFGENMVTHTVDYYSSAQTKIPPIIGFDIFIESYQDTQTEKQYGYDEGFEGFVSYDIVVDVLENANISTATSLDHSSIYNPETDETPTVPMSSISSVQAEGVVFRNDTDEFSSRVKYRRPEFIEKNKEVFGNNPDAVPDGAEWIVAKYCTNARIQKVLTKMVVDEGREFSLQLNDVLYPRVVDDIWDEHYHEIKQLDMKFNPSNISPLVAERCISRLRLLEQNARITNREPTDIWRISK